MKILSISTDRTLFDSKSRTARRQVEYYKELNQVCFIVFSLRSGDVSPVKIAENILVYPTNSLSRWLYVFDAIKLARKLEFKPDLITCQDTFETGLVGWLVSKKINCDLELQIHTDISSPYFKRVYFLNRIRLSLANFLLPRAHQIRVVSERVRNFLVNDLGLPESRIEVRPIAVDTEKIKQAPITIDLHEKYPQFDQIILMASRLTQEKNISLAIKAMRIMIKEKPKTGLIIVGSGEENYRLQLLASSFQLSGNVIFEDWANQETLYSYYKTCDLFLLTSFYEGYGMTLIEAQAAGCPIVSTDVGVAREVGATIIDVFNPHSVAETLIKN